MTGAFEDVFTDEEMTFVRDIQMAQLVADKSLRRVPTAEERAAADQQRRDELKAIVAAELERRQKGGS